MGQKKINKGIFFFLLFFSSIYASSIKPNGAKGPDLSTSYPIIDGNGGYFELGILAEQVRLSNTDIAYLIQNGKVSPIDGQVGKIANMLRLDFDVNAGLKTAAGYYFEYDQWLIKAAFEWFYSKGSANFKSISSLTGTVAPTYIPHVFYNANTHSTQFLELDASLKINYYLLDIILGRGSYISGHLSYEPFAGIKSSWIYFDGNERYAKDSASNMPTSTTWLRTEDKSFWAVGPMLGMNLNYYLNQYISIFSNLDISLLFGEAKLLSSTGFVTVESMPTDYEIKDKNPIVSPFIRTILGLQYETDAFYDSQHFTLKAGFDGRAYYNQYPIANRTATTVNSSGSTALKFDPTIVENGSFGMLGLIFTLIWDY